jgi:hypothetical protein
MISGIPSHSRERGTLAAVCRNKECPKHAVNAGVKMHRLADPETVARMQHRKTADRHLVVTGPHVMLFGPSSKALGYPRTADPDPTKPYMMWPNTPYEHAMVPVK